jgi:Tfp pilus assembly PilM family ATPase
MTGIATRIKLYQQAFQLAREHIAKDHALNDRAGIAHHLHEAIKREIATGKDDVIAIAASAVRALQQNLDR